LIGITGGQYPLIANNGPNFAGGRDTNGVYASGFKLTDYVSPDIFARYDAFRITKVEYLVSLANMPRQSVPNVRVYSSVDLDDGISPSGIAALMARPNKALTVLTSTAPTQKALDFKPRRRIGGNVDNSLMVIPTLDEWCDCTFAPNLIFGNVKWGIVCPDGQAQYSVSDQGSVLVTSRIWVEFKSRISG
jgi:hypothetical protein